MNHEPVTQAFHVMDSILELARPVNKEALCQYLQIERTTLEYYNGLGLPRFKVGNEIRYHIPDVLHFFRERGIKSGTERFAYESEA